MKLKFNISCEILPAESSPIPHCLSNPFTLSPLFNKWNSNLNHYSDVILNLNEIIECRLWARDRKHRPPIEVAFGRFTLAELISENDNQCTWVVI